VFKNKKIWGKRGPLPFKHAFLLSFVIFMIITSQSLWLTNTLIEPTLLSIAKTKTRQMVYQAIDNAISKEIVENMDIRKLIIIHENNKGEAIGYSFNPQIYNRLLAETNMRIQQYLNYIETGELERLESFEMNDIHVDYDQTKKQRGIVYYIPLGMATGNALLANLGPKLPVRFEMIGDTNSDIETKVKEFGINNTYLEVYLNIRVRMNLIVPFSDMTMKISHSMKIADLFLQGKVPRYYNGSGSTNEGIDIPPLD